MSDLEMSDMRPSCRCLCQARPEVQWTRLGKDNDKTGAYRTFPRRLTHFHLYATLHSPHVDSSTIPFGAVAQLGERMTGSHEVRGSIPLGSTNPIKQLQITPEIHKR